MSRDPEITRAFEIADDSLQGLLGYYLYVTNAARCAPKDCILANLPPDRIPITHAWDRFYSPQELIATIDKVFLTYQTRVCLVAMVNIFEVAARCFTERLKQVGSPPVIPGKNKKSYFNRLRWVFDKVANPSVGDPAIEARIPDVCLDVDHARRLRNISVHNNGLFNDRYAKDCIRVEGRQSLMHAGYSQYTKDKTRPTPMILQPSDYEQLSKSHIELLHVLRHEIQRQDFGDTAGYSYRDEKKRIEWHRLLFGS